MERWIEPIALAAMFAWMLTACAATQTIETTVSSHCRAYCEIQYSASQDTPETVVQIREHNAAYRANCPENACVIDAEKVRELEEE